MGINIKMDCQRVGMTFSPRWSYSTRVHVCPQVVPTPKCRPDLMYRWQLPNVPLRLTPPQRNLIQLRRNSRPRCFIVNRHPATSRNRGQNVITHRQRHQARKHRESTVTYLLHLNVPSHHARLSTRRFHAQQISKVDPGPSARTRSGPPPPANRSASRIGRREGSVCKIDGLAIGGEQPSYRRGRPRCLQSDGLAFAYSESNREIAI